MRQRPNSLANQVTERIKSLLILAIVVVERYLLFA
jgi:hypothetical protein